MLLTRAPIVRIVDRAETLTVLGPRGSAREFSGDSAELVRAVLEVHARPAVSRVELMGELAERAGGEVPSQIVDDVLALLVEDGVLVAPQPAMVRPMGGRRVVLAISAAVAAVDAPAIVRGLYALGCDVRVALSKSAKQFVSIAALQAITHHQVWSSMWQRDARVPVPHVNLAEWAELVLVCPASATTIARITSGDCSDLVSAIVTATRAPVVIVPSMNDAMYSSPAVQQNLETLRAHGRVLVHPAMGVEVAHAPGERRAMLGPAPPAAAIIDIVRHVLGTAPHLPKDADGWERLWSSTPIDRLPWHADDIDASLANALDARARGATTNVDAPAGAADAADARGMMSGYPRNSSSGRRLVDLGTGSGTVAIAAARRGFLVTATDVSATALGRARERAGELPILFVLDDITQPRLDTQFDIAVDCGLLHCLPRAQWDAYARAVTMRVAIGGTLILVAHQRGAELATTAITVDELRALLPAFDLARATETTLSRRPATLFELERRDRVAAP